MLLGIDYGLKKIGLAQSEGSFSEPLATLEVKTVADALSQVVAQCERLKVEKIIIGISEGKSRDRTVGFGAKLQGLVSAPVVYIDETLTTVEAETLTKIQSSEDHARAAAIILQRYLDGEAEIFP